MLLSAHPLAQSNYGDNNISQRQERNGKPTKISGDKSVNLSNYSTISLAPISSPATAPEMLVGVSYAQ
jgi:hypothetical protein